MSKTDDSKLFAFLGILLTLIGFIIVLATKKDDKYAMYYGKQGLILFIVGVIAGIVMLIVSWIPVFGLIIYWLLWLCLVLIWVVGMIYALSGEEKELPLIGKYADMVKI